MDWSKAKVNKVLNEVIDAGYVSAYNGSKGRYLITEKGYSTIDKYN